MPASDTENPGEARMASRMSIHREDDHPIEGNIKLLHDSFSKKFMIQLMLRFSADEI
ncbi:MAG: hypothetical protein ABEK50_00945 [bacterium]